MSQPASTLSQLLIAYDLKSMGTCNNRAVSRKCLLAFILVFGSYFCLVLSAAIMILLLRETVGMKTLNLCIFAMWGLAEIVLLVLSIRWYRKANLPSSFADFIQPKGRMRFFLKDGKIGLVNGFDFKILVPASYDKLVWVQENEMMKATLGEEEFLIDIYNNRYKP